MRGNDLQDSSHLPSNDMEQLAIANFIDESGEVVQQWDATDLPLPSSGEYVSFGRVQNRSDYPVEDSEYEMGNVYLVNSVEYNYSKLLSEEGDVITRFVSVLLHIEDTGQN
jgi:hypothetical protein